MKLKPLHSSPSSKLAGRVPGELHAELIAYAAYYREVVGQSIDLWPLVIQMLLTFVDTDRLFHAWRRQHRSSAATRSDGSQSEVHENGERRGHESGTAYLKAQCRPIGKSR